MEENKQAYFVEIIPIDYWKVANNYPLLFLIPHKKAILIKTVLNKSAIVK